MTNLAIKRSDVNLHKIIVYLANDINDLDDYYIVFDTKNRNTELDTLSNNGYFNQKHFNNFFQF